MRLMLLAPIKIICGKQINKHLIARGIDPTQIRMIPTSSTFRETTLDTRKSIILENLIKN